jgi:hypothetical protein
MTTTSLTDSPRRRELADELAGMKLKGGSAEPERRLLAVGIIIAVVGIVLAISGWISSNNTNNTLNQNTDLSMGIAGLTLALVGGLIWVRHSLTRYTRYFLARMIFEDRAQTDRIIDAISGGPSLTQAVGTKAPKLQGVNAGQ